MHDTWRSQGADDRLETEIWDIPHSCPLKAQERVLQFFQKHLYSTYLVGEGNMYNRMLPDSHYGYNAKDIKREQARIEKELLDFEQDLWEY